MVVADHDEDLPKLLAGLERVEGTLHHRQAEKQQAKTEQDFADVTPLLVFREKLEARAYADRRKSILGDLEGDQLGSHRGADIGPQDDAD